VIGRLNEAREAVLRQDGTVIEGSTLVDNRLLAILVDRVDDCCACPVLQDGLRRQVADALELAGVLRDLGVDTESVQEDLPVHQ
jgi:hypothetical protein